MSSSKQSGLLGILMGVLILGLCAMAFAGIFIDEWTIYKGQVGNGFIESDVVTSFTDYSETVMGEDMKIEDFEKLEISFNKDDSAALMKTMVAFGYIALVAVAALTLLYLLKMLLNVGVLRFITGIVGIAAIAVGAILIGVTASYCSNFVANVSIGTVLSGELVMGLGAYLAPIGVMGAGVAAVVGCARK